jgi:hypothetical protein
MSEIANSSLDTKQYKRSSSNIYTSFRTFNRYHSTSSTYSSEILKNHLLDLYGDETPQLEKQALMRKTGFSQSNCSDISTKNLLMYMVLTVWNLNQRRLLEDSKVQNSFQIVMVLRLKCALTKHMTTLKEFANFSARTRSQTGHELIRDMSALRMDVTTRFSNMAGTLKVGDDWTAPTKTIEKLSAIKIKEIDADGKSRML